MIDTEIKVTPQIAAEHGLTPGRIRAHPENSGTRSEFHRAGNFQRDVERALLLQILQSAFEAPADDSGRMWFRALAKMRASWTSATAWCAVFKIESHNHPSFVEPFQGAATDVGGILRDIFTMGARPIAVLDSLRFGPDCGRAWSRKRQRGRNRAQSAYIRRRDSRNRLLRKLFWRPDSGRGNCLRALLFE